MTLPVLGEEEGRQKETGPELIEYENGEKNNIQEIICPGEEEDDDYDCHLDLNCTG